MFFVGMVTRRFIGVINYGTKKSAIEIGLVGKASTVRVIKTSVKNIFVSELNRHFELLHILRKVFRACEKMMFAERTTSIVIQLAPCSGYILFLTENRL